LVVNPDVWVGNQIRTLPKKEKKAPELLKRRREDGTGMDLLRELRGFA
jgi:hypothetical protein